MLPAHGGRALAAVAGTLALVVSAACDATPAGHGLATATPSAAGGVAMPPGAVPWAPVPIAAYLPTPLPLPTAAPAPRCTLDELAAQPISTGGATGNDALFFDFTNRTSRPCLTGGYPRVVVSQSGQRTLVATPGGFWDEHTPAMDLAPGAIAQFDLGFSYACETGNPPPLYEHVVVTLPGGGTFAKVLTGVKPQNSQIPVGVFVQCGVTVSELSGPAQQTAYPHDALLGLTAAMTAPTSVPAGTLFTYVIALTNPTSNPIALDPCRGYYQLVDGMKSPFFSYELNCAAAHPIPAHGTERFVMEMTAAGLAAGAHHLDWHLDTDGTQGPEASGNFTVS